jgi:hypothetical protein
MQPIDEALVFEAIRYQAAYRAKVRRNHHKSIPGPLVAEVFRYIEGSMEGVTQRELELLLLSSRTSRTARLDGDNLGAQWRAYVAHRGRDSQEKKEWRAWYGKYGKKEAIRQSYDIDPFCIQQPPLPLVDFEEGHGAPEHPSRPLMRGLPQDGRPMTFHKMRNILSRWEATLTQRAIEQVSCWRQAEQVQSLVKMLYRVQMRLRSIVEIVNGWEAANQLLASEIWMSESGNNPVEFYEAFARVADHYERKQKEVVEYWTKRFPGLFSYDCDPPPQL